MKIDFVMMWVDGNDLKWRKEKNKYLPKEDEVNNEVRFRDWELLKYWFRGVEKYAPWVNKIYFVTWGHIPSWLDTSNEKLVVVNHKDFIDEKYLPTFNSHTIELNLHKIKGLSEYFILFNDDTFITDYMYEKDFFINNLPCDSAILNPIISVGYDHFSNVSTNNLSIINNNFNKKSTFKHNKSKWYSLKYGKDLIRTIALMPWNRFPGFYNSHLPNAFLKSTFKEVWKKENTILDETCMCKFRNNYTNVNQWLIKYWQFASNKFMPRSPKIGKYYEISDNNEEIINSLKNHSYKMICLNDSIKINNFDKVKSELTEVFEELLNSKSKFEK